jgi:hypothetical protein
MYFIYVKGTLYMSKFEKLVLGLLHCILYRLIHTTKPGDLHPLVMDILPSEKRIMCEVEQEIFS